MGIANPLFGVGVVQFDGENYESIVRAMEFEEGDMVICIPGRPIKMRAALKDEIEFVSEKMFPWL